MSLADLLLTALVAILCGTLAQLTSGYSRAGWFVNMAFGFLGALAGVIISRTTDVPIIFDLNVRNTLYPIIYAISGSVFFLALVGILIKPTRR